MEDSEVENAISVVRLADNSWLWAVTQLDLPDMSISGTAESEKDAYAVARAAYFWSSHMDDE